MGNLTRTLVSFTAGVVAGAALGILYAPDKGIHTRNKLTFQLDRYRKRLKELIDLLSDEQSTHFNVAKSEGQKVVSETKEKAERLLTDVEELMSQIKNKN
jgi:gas vesicle protein